MSSKISLYTVNPLSKVLAIDIRMANPRRVSATKILKEIFDAEEELKEKKTQVSIAFIDMVGSTAYKDQKGIEAGLKHVVHHNVAVTKVIRELGRKYKTQGQIADFRVCKYIGDEVMAYFMGKKAAKTAIETAIAIQRKLSEINNSIQDPSDKFQAKIGIDYGAVFFYEYLPGLEDPHGLIVDRAARLVTLAKASQILVSEDVKKACKSSNIKFGKSAEIDLKGIRGKVNVYEVVFGRQQGIASIESKEEYARYIPRLLKFELSERIYRLDTRGNARVTWNVIVENVSDKPLQRVKLPVVCDVYDEEETQIKYITVDELKVGTKNIRNCEECYEPLGILKPKQAPNREMGSFIIPFSEIGDLKKGMSVRAQISYRLREAFRNMSSEDGEFTTMDFHHYTEKFRVVIYAPVRKTISLMSERNHPNGFDVVDINADLIDPKTMSDTPEPKKLTRNCIKWEVAHPYRTYRYRLYFRVL